jgi:hypothetical protein
MSRFVLAATLLALSSTASAAQATLLKLGALEGAVTASVGADEFSSTGFTDAVVFEAGTLPFQDTTPALVGSMALDSASCGGRGCARVLTVRFTVPTSYAGLPLLLDYSRYGGEIDTLRYDGVSIGNISVTEDENMATTFYLGSSTAGDHSLQIQVSAYMGGGHHYIDQLRLYAVTP